MAAPTLSMTMIARDEEATIGRVLFQANTFCDQLVVVDTGSTDRTVSIAEAAGARVLSFPWVDDFAAARNHALDAATSDWVIWLDADDVVTREMQGAFSDLKESVLSEELDAVYAQYRYHFDDTGACTFAFPRERLVRRTEGARWVGVVHEVLDIPGSNILHRDDLYIEHRPAPTKRETKAGRNLRILQKAVDSGDRTKRTRFYFARELKDNGRYDEAYAAFGDYLTDPESTWEQHSALLGMAECALALDRPEDARTRLYEALTLDPRRGEPFLVLGFLHFKKEEYAEALPWYAAATALVRPGDGFTQPADYSWRPWDYLSVCLINTGRYAEGVKAAMRAIELGAPDLERLRKNAQWALDQLAPA
jgi:glycosyltransferase involved in cell wall biosynthesis